LVKYYKKSKSQTKSQTNLAYAQKWGTKTAYLAIIKSIQTPDRTN